MTALPVRRAHELDAQPEEQRWLIEGLWSAEAVGILGGEPKCCKSFLALDMAVAVASGASCLRRFPTYGAAGSCSSPPRTRPPSCGSGSPESPPRWACRSTRSTST